MRTTLKLPIPAIAAVLLAFGIVELFLRERGVEVGPRLAMYALVLGTLLVLPRAPALVVGLILLELLVLKETRFVTMLGTATSLLTPFAAFFAAAVLLPTRRVWVLVALLAAHMAWRLTLPMQPWVALYQDTTLYLGAIAAGAMLHHRHQRLAEILADRDRLVTALATGPGDAATAEQLRMWSLLEQRIEPVIEALPREVEASRHAPERLETIRAQAADALAEMQATIRSLGDPEPPPPITPEHAPLRLRAISPLWIACALVLVAAVIEMLAADTVSVYAVAFALIPLLAPRAPIVASVLVVITAIVCSLDSGIPVAARTADFSAVLTLLVAGSSARPARAVASLVIVTTGLLVSQGLDPTMDWPALAFIATAVVYLTNWLFAVLLRDVAAEQRQVGRSLADAADALAALRQRAVRRERVRLAHELHDLVGHALTAVAIQAGVAKAQRKRGLQPAFGPLEEAARQGVVELQRLATVLGHETDLTAELERVTDTARATGQHVELELRPPETELAPQLRHTVVCVAAEALTNAAKHAGGAAVRVSLKARADRLELAVSDDGGHAHDLPSGGRGLDSMARRVQDCGGTFASGPRPDGGWTVQAVLPLSV
ncbi:histidine kinase [Solirubrobacter phytolaccae]|uniref:histidine kinase n=1 Tax=Solirubrobacter phytolaccae TaxID=1404360 RepID=A0A9X3NBE9_9ACTN|nr:histidine kinase [Solirubrobacter phytolaccae]MDA0181672.1 histidine kinase [Solirubrobacter phytolaccae]